MNKQLLIIKLILLTFLAVSCSQEEEEEVSHSQEEEVSQEVSLCNDCLTFDHNGTERTYYLHIPDNLPANAPLVLYLHGYHGDATVYKNHGFDNIADANGFAVVYPQGLIDATGTLH